MARMRVVSDNCVDRGTITASSTAGALSATRLQNDDKTEVWRATGKALETLSVVLPASETASCLHLPHCNLSPTATMRLRLTNEAAATNLMLHSGTIGNAAYIKTDVTVNGTLILAPDGTTTGVTLNETATTTSHTVRQALTLSASTTYTFSVLVQALGRSRIRLQDSMINCYVNFDITAGVVLSSVGAAIVSSSVTPAPNGGGWYRISMTYTTVAAGSRSLMIYILDASGNFSYLGDVTKGVSTWGWQMETGSLSSYYPTTTAAAARPVGYMDAWQSYTLDTGAVLACPAPARVPRGWSAATAASAYSNGGGAHARLWFPPTTWHRAIVTIADPNNVQAAIEAARLIIAPYWEPEYGATGAVVTPVDSTEIYRTAAGSQGAIAGYIHRVLPVDLGLLKSADRTTFMNLLMNSRAYPLLVSMFPEHSDLSLERDHCVYGRRPRDSDVAYQFAGAYSSKVEIEEI